MAPLFAFAGQMMILIAVFGWQVLWLTLPATMALGIVAAFAYAALAVMRSCRAASSSRSPTRSPNAIVVATLGVSLVLMELGRIAADTRDFWLPPMLASAVVFAPKTRLQGDADRIQLIDCAVAAGVALPAAR